MFATLDTAAGVPKGRTKNTADRACDQCKVRKVRCDMGNPCVTCGNRNLSCTYNEERKKRGPVASRISKIQRLQQGNRVSEGGEGILDFRRISVSPAAEAASPTSPPGRQNKNGHSRADSDYLAPHGLLHPEGDSTVSTRSGPATCQPSLSLLLTPGEDSAQTTACQNIPSPQQTGFLLPSLPVDSPSDSIDLFASIAQEDLPPIAATADFWPGSISQEAMLPWIDVYFKRLHPTVPVLNRTMIYQEMLLRRHHRDPHFGAMLLALCAFAMTQPVQIHEVQSNPSRSAQARRLLEESIKMRTTVDFGEDPSLHMVLTSFFLFACLFGSGLHKAAHHRLREAVDLANSLSMHLPQAYDGLDRETREQWLRTYLVLSVTERAYALQKHHPIGFRGSPAVNAYFVRAFAPPSPPAVARDNTDAVSMTGLLYLMETFDAIDESVVECWIGSCKFSDGYCETFDRRRAVQMFQAQHRVREACLAGNISFASDASPWPLDQLLENQRADISVTQLWLLNRLWNLCLSHGLLREVSDRAEFRFNFAYHIASALVDNCSNLCLPAMEVHGIGFIAKVYDIAIGPTMAMEASSGLALDSRLTRSDLLTDQAMDDGPSVKELLQALDKLIRSFRGGNHEYTLKFATVLGATPGYYQSPLAFDPSPFP